MDTLIGAVIFIVMVIFGLARKAQESSQKSDPRRERKPVNRADLPDSTRRILYGESGATGVREAKRRMPQGARQVAPREGEPLAPGKMLLESLLGAPPGEEDEGDWVPAQEAAPRQQAPRRAQEVRQVPDATRRAAPPAATAGQATRQTPQQGTRQAPQQGTRQAPQQAPRQAPRRAPRRQSAAPELQAQRPHRSRPKATQRRQRPAAVQAALRRGAQPLSRHHAIFGGIREVRKAIVFAEILGPPKAFVEIEGRPQGQG